jgi:5'-nucleotidase
MDRIDGTLFRSQSPGSGSSGGPASARRPLILVTNDDGYDAPGIAALTEAVMPLGRVIVVAPDREQSGAAHALTLEIPLRVIEVDRDRYRVTGTPTDCVHLAVTRLTGERLPDLIVSGINRGVNIGDDVTYSGTVAGALEGTLLHIPSIAFSVDIDDQGRAGYESALPFARKLSAEVLRRGLPSGVLLNVNFPVGQFGGVRITRQGTSTYRATAIERQDPSGRPYFWIASADTRPTGEPDGDHRAVADGFVSVSPLQANLTHDPSLASLVDWHLELD